MRPSIKPKPFLLFSLFVLGAVLFFVHLGLKDDRERESMLERVAEVNRSLVCGRDKMIDMEGNEYDTVEIDFQCWMAENMRSTVDAWREGTKRYCYDNDPSNCEIYGGLYSAAAAETICPHGWRLPGDDDFKDMERTLGLEPPELDTNGWRGESIGEMIKDPSWDGTGESRFNALPGGLMRSDGRSQWVGEQAHFWGVRFSSDESWRRFFASGESRSFRGVALRDLRFSVRCLKN